MGKKVDGVVTTFGAGSVREKPDLMRVTLSVESRASTVAIAYGRAGQRVAAVTTSLRDNGVGDADIATGGLSVRSETVWTEGQGNRVTGYVATSDLVIALRDLAGDPGPADILARAVEAGGDDVRLGGLTLTFADQADLLARARDAAWDDALGRARRYAERAGRTLGEVLEITENTAAAPSFAPKMRAMAAPIAEYGGSVQVELGESEVTANLRATWRLD